MFTGLLVRATPRLSYVVPKHQDGNSEDRRSTCGFTVGALTSGLESFVRNTTASSSADLHNHYRTSKNKESQDPNTQKPKYNIALLDGGFPHLHIHSN